MDYASENATKSGELAQAAFNLTLPLFDLLAPAKGVTVDHIAATLGWLPHTTRAALTGLKKDGVVIEKLPPLKDTNHSRYRLAREG